jgi:hypothetical protein
MAWPFGYLVGFTGGAFDLHRHFIEATREMNTLRTFGIGRQQAALTKWRRFIQF